MGPRGLESSSALYRYYRIQFQKRPRRWGRCACHYKEHDEVTPVDPRVAVLLMNAASVSASDSLAEPRGRCDMTPRQPSGSQRERTHAHRDEDWVLSGVRLHERYDREWL
jgi:hypothetical protein